MEVSRLNRSLDIFWDGRIVGRYDLLEDGSELFAYDVGYLDSSGATPISHSLPLRADPYGRRQLRPFFAGLLPEESQRQRIAAYLGLAESDDFSMLYDGRNRRLAPGYDLVSTVFWPALASAPAMKIGGSDSINSILSGHWRKFAQETGVSLTALRTRIAHLCAAVKSHTCESLAIPLECEGVLSIIRDRAERLKPGAS